MSSPPPSRPSRASDLPEPILQRIFGYTYHAEPYTTRYRLLWSFSLVCSSWRYPAQKDIFEELTISSETPPDLYDVLTPINSEAGTTDAVLLARMKTGLRLSGYIQSLVLVLDEHDVLPDEFPLFLEGLTSIRELCFLEDTGRVLFHQGPQNVSQPLVSALLKVFRLPSLKTLTMEPAGAQGVPLSFIPCCPNLEQLVIGCDPKNIRRGEELICSCSLCQVDLKAHWSGRTLDLQKLTIRGGSDQIVAFTDKVIREPEYQLSLQNIREMTLGFMDGYPQSEAAGAILALGSTVEVLTFMFDSRPDPKRRGNRKFNLKTSHIQSLTNLRSLEVIHTGFHRFTRVVSSNHRASLQLGGGGRDQRRLSTNTLLHGGRAQPNPESEYLLAIEKPLSEWILPLLERLPRPDKLRRIKIPVGLPSYETILSRGAISAVVPDNIDIGVKDARWAVDDLAATRFRNLEEVRIFIPSVEEVKPVIVDQFPKLKERGVLTTDRGG